MIHTPFSDLVGVLRGVGLAADADAIADALWLAQSLPAPPERRPRLGDPANVVAPAAPAPNGDNTTIGLDRPRPTPAPPIVDPPPGPVTPLFPSVIDGKGGRRASAVQVPATTALPGSLDIARALRPFGRRYPALHRRILDEDATVEATARFGFVRPVLRPVPERWFDVALVIDGSRSMEVWQKTIEQFHQLLARQGSFAKVSRWRLSVADRVVVVTPGGEVRDVAALNDPRRRTLVLLVTNGVASLWEGSAIASALDEWSRHGPVAILQMFSEKLWAHTLLGPPTRSIHSTAPGAPTRDLVIEREPWELPVADTDRPLAVPIVALAAESVERWAETVMAMGQQKAAAVVFAPEVATPQPKPESAPPSPPLDARTRVERSRSIASGDAFRLLCYLAAVPVTLPIMRLVQQQVCRLPLIEQLGEVIASGLIERITPERAQLEPEMVLYDFVAGARDVLYGTIQLGVAYDVRAQVQSAMKGFIERHLGRSIDNFRAFVLDESGDHELPLTLQAFVQIERDLLRRTRSPQQQPPATLKWILVAGTGTYRLPSETHLVARALGPVLAEAGYGLICGGWPGVDHIVAREFVNSLRNRNIDPVARFRQHAETGREPDFRFGEPIRVTDANWARDSLSRCDAVILLGGVGGVREIFTAALSMGKPVIPLAGTGGDATQAFNALKFGRVLQIFPDRRALSLVGDAAASTEQAADLAKGAMALLRVTFDPPTRRGFRDYSRAICGLVRRFDPAASQAKNEELRGYLHDLADAASMDGSQPGADLNIAEALRQAWGEAQARLAVFDLCLLDRLSAEWAFARTLSGNILASVAQHDVSPLFEAHVLQRFADEPAQGREMLRKWQQAVVHLTWPATKTDRERADAMLGRLDDALLHRLLSAAWPLAERYLMPAGIVEHERVFHELRDVVRRGISLSASDVVGSLLSSENPVQRILGYAIVSMEPRGEFLEPLVAALELEAETATETKETRPLFQLLCRFGEAFANSAVAPWITQAGVRRALDQVMALLTRRGDLDPGRECRSLLTSLIAQVAAISTGTVSETPWRESTVRSVCDVLKAIALSLHVRGFAVPSPSDLDEQLGRRLRWGTAAVGQLRGDCEWQLPRWIEAAVLPIRHRIGALVPREARVQTDAPLADLLVWVLETLADTCMGVASVEPEFPHYYFFNEEERLEALIRRYPALAKRLSGTVAILESHGGSTDAATLAAAYDTAAEVLRPDAERVAGALEAGIEPPPIDAHALLKFVDAHVMRHLNRPRRDLPVATLRDGSVLDPQRVARVLGEIEPLQFVNPDWVAARERWRELDLAEGSEDEHAFVMLALKRLQAVAQAHVEEFGDHDIALGFEVPVGSASEADEVLRISELGISISIATNGTNEGPQANLSGPIRVFCLTLNRISEYLERLLRPSRSDAPSSVE